MFETVTPKKAMAFTQRVVALAYCWPPPRTATRFQVLRFKILRLMTCLNSFLLFLPLLYTVYLRHDSVLEAIRSACLLVAVFHVIVHTIYFTTQYTRLQKAQLYSVDLLQWLINQMKDYLDKAKPYERRIFQLYTNKYYKFYGITAVWNYSTAVIVALGTLFISRPFPTDAQYPFPVDYEPLRSIIFLHQSFVAIQCAAQINTSVFAALLMFFAAARFEIVNADLRHADDIHTLVKCLKKYYDTKRYADEVVAFTQYVALISLIAVTLSLVLFGFLLIGVSREGTFRNGFINQWLLGISILFEKFPLHLMMSPSSKFHIISAKEPTIQRQPLTVKVQFMCLVASGLLEAFTYALPADQLMDMSQNFMNGAYESTWYNRSLKLQKFVLYIMLPQKPAAISFKGIVPVLSLNYYCSFISNIFSMFAALRVMVEKVES
ncbi:uncharacterized protein LOC143181406 [Calliopsis andreniformis]|uniref:uncharacterized protein LOC143181406 n=1 Tax=Calliopsis andreniformis TaxID=337506 RepID=UPI003FCC7B8C